METRYKIIQAHLKSIITSKITYDDGVLCIEGLDRNGVKTIKINFNDVLLVQIADESMRLRLVQTLESHCGLILIDTVSHP